MPTQIEQTSAQDAKIRYQEPYVSEGLNKKFHGVVPRGVVRGGRIVPAGSGLNVDLKIDPLYQDSVYSYVDDTGHQITYRESSDRSLSLGSFAESVVYIALHINYTNAGPTTVEWRAYTESEYDAGDADIDRVIVVGRVDVPDSGPIPAENVTPRGRMDAWEGVSPGILPWTQVVGNPRFDVATTGVFAQSGTVNANRIPRWDPYNHDVGSQIGSAFTWSISSSDPRSGQHELQISGTGVSTPPEWLPAEGVYPLQPNNKIRVIFWIRGDSWGGVGGSGVQGARIDFYDGEFGFISTEYVTDNTLNGTFDYQKIDHILSAPSNAAHMILHVGVDPDGVNGSGDLFFDEVRCWVEDGVPESDVEAPLTADKGRRFMSDSSLLSSLFMTPRRVSSDISDFISEMIRFGFDRYNTTSLRGTVPDFSMGRLDAEEWVLRLIGGGIEIPKYIRDLGGDLIGTGQFSDLETPRIETRVDDNSSFKHTLLWKITPDNGAPPIRVYGTYESLSDSVPALVVTSNAFIRSDVSDYWGRDSNSDDSVMFEISALKFEVFIHDSSDADLWENLSNDNSNWSVPTGIQMANRAANIVTTRLFQFEGPESSTKNPQIGDNFFPATITQNNVVKAWGNLRVEAGGSGVSLQDGYNLAAPSIVAGGDRVEIFFDADVLGGSYAVLITPELHSENATASDAHKTSGSFEIQGREFDSSGNNNPIDFSNKSVTSDYSIVVLARD